MERNRRPDIDWLRVFATYLLFVFHVGKVFDPAPFYHVRNADRTCPAIRRADSLRGCEGDTRFARRVRVCR